jgi:hypothetical protein
MAGLKAGCQAHAVRALTVHSESGFFIFEILALVLHSLAGAKCEPALPVNESKCLGETFVLEF